MKGRTTIVIPYKVIGDGNELRFVLRSIALNAKFKYQIVIVGEAPEWINRDKILCLNPDIEKRSEFPKAFNVIDKLKFIVKNDQIDDDILLCYDDIVFLNTIRKTDITTIIANSLLPENEDFKTDASDVWKKIMINTMRALKRNKMTWYNFETHLPRLFNKQKLSHLFEKFGFKKRPYMISTLYFNEYHANKPPRILKESPGSTKIGLYFDGDFENNKENILEHKFLNWGEKQWTDELKKYLLQLFPDKSIYEN